MSPFLKAGDRLHACKTPWRRLKVGDLIVFKDSFSKHPIIHRLIGWQYCNGNNFGVLKGDNWPHTDNFLLTPDNYVGRVWVLEQRGKLVTLDSLYQRLRARCIAWLSVWNLTPGLARIKLKKNLQRMVPLIPGVKTIESFIFKKARYFIFPGPDNTKRLCASIRGMLVGEIILEDNPQRVSGSKVFSIFSTVIAPERLAAHALKRFPELLKQGCPGNENIRI